MNIRHYSVLSGGCRLERLGLPLVLLVGLLLTGLSSPVFAQDGVGIYWDTGFIQNTTEIDPIPGAATGYLVMHGPAAAGGVLGWELCVDVEGSGSFLGWTFEGETINALEPPCFRVGIFEPIPPVGGAVHLATFQYLVTDLRPAVFSLIPPFAASLPDQISFISGTDPDQLVPIGTATGRPDVATINPENPWLEVDVDGVFFGVQPTGLMAFQFITLTNAGGGGLDLNLNISAGCDVFSLPDITGPVYIPAGESLLVKVGFTPDALEAFTCYLEFGDVHDPLILQGTGREPIYGYTVWSERNFGEVNTGEFRDLTAAFRNTGEVPIPITPELLGCGADFSIIAGAEPTVVEAFQLRIINVRFEPTVPETLTCTLAYAEGLDQTSLRGIGKVATLSFQAPTEVDFGRIDVGSGSVRDIGILNTGDLTFTITPGLAACGDEFSFVSGGQPTTLGPGQFHSVRVLFAPNLVGAYECALTLGDVVPDVLLTGSTTDVAWQITPDQVVMPTTTVGGSSEATVRVESFSPVDLYLDVQLDSGNTAFAITAGAGPVTLAPQAVHEISLRFEPDVAGFYPAVLILGGGLPTVPVGGLAIVPPVAGVDEIGIFFDEAYTANEIQTPPGLPVTGYVVLFNPSDPLGISGWECSIDVVGVAFILQWYYSGNTINIGTPPDFVVGIAEPLPPAAAVQLASFDILVLYTNTAVLLEMGPVSNPYVPGQMVYIAGDQVTPIAMSTVTGDPIVATINAGVPVATAAPTPEMTLNGAAVHLTWPAPQMPDPECHVYRREAEGAAERLTLQPLTTSAATLTYTDHPTGFVPGTKLFYSYAVMIEGVEAVRSPEVEVTVPSVPVLATQLLPNVPNPFNPQTEIRFELAQPSRARVAIYDVTGKEVKVLHSGHLEAGPHTRVWQGRDAGGRRMSSGAYYVRLVVDGKVDHRKIMLLK